MEVRKGMYRIAVLTEQEKTRGSRLEAQIAQFCKEKGLFPQIEQYQNQEEFFEAVPKAVFSNAVIALPGIAGLNAVEHLPPSYCCKYREAPAMTLILDIHGDPWYHISNFKEGNDKKSRASQMAKRAACGESSAGGPPEDGLGASGPNGQARRDCPLQQQGIYGIVRRTCQVLFR